MNSTLHIRVSLYALLLCAYCLATQSLRAQAPQILDTNPPYASMATAANRPVITSIVIVHPSPSATLFTTNAYDRIKNDSARIGQEIRISGDNFIAGGATLTNARQNEQWRVIFTNDIAGYDVRATPMTTSSADRLNVRVPVGAMTGKIRTPQYFFYHNRVLSNGTVTEDVAGSSYPTNTTGVVPVLSFSFRDVGVNPGGGPFSAALLVSGQPLIIYCSGAAEVANWNEVSFDGGMNWVVASSVDLKGMVNPASVDRISGTNQIVGDEISVVIPPASMIVAGTLIRMRHNDGTRQGALASDMGTQVWSDYIEYGSPPPETLTVTSISPNGACPAMGSTVTITGTSFSTTASENTITFLGNSGSGADDVVVLTASITVISATEMRVVIPNDVQTGRIRVERNDITSGGSSPFADSPGDFTVSAYEITNISPPVVVQGVPITITLACLLLTDEISFDGGSSFRPLTTAEQTSTTTVTVAAPSSISGSGIVLRRTSATNIRTQYASGVQTPRYLAIAGAIGRPLYRDGSLLYHPYHVGQEIRITGSNIPATSDNTITFLGATGTGDDVEITGIAGSTSGDFIDFFRLPIGARTGSIRLTTATGATAELTISPDAVPRDVQYIGYYVDTLRFRANGTDIPRTFEREGTSYTTGQEVEANVGQDIRIFIEGGAVESFDQDVSPLVEDWIARASRSRYATQVSFGEGPWVDVDFTSSSMTTSNVDGDDTYVIVSVPGGSKSGRLRIRHIDRNPSGTTVEGTAITSLTSADVVGLEEREQYVKIVPTITSFLHPAGGAAITATNRISEGNMFNIIGTGFSPTATENIVTFQLRGGGTINATASSVSADGTMLTVAVPTDAITGVLTVTVTVPSGLTSPTMLSAARTSTSILFVQDNRAPTLAAPAPTNNTITVTEDDTNPSGQTVAIFRNLAGAVADPDEVSPADIYAITAINTPASSGKWEYRASGGIASWTDLTISGSQFFRVGGSVEVRFLPTTLNYNTSGVAVANRPSLTVAALDATDVTPDGDFGMIPSPRGLASFMSIEERMLLVEVMAVNDAPTLASATGSNIITLLEDAMPLTIFTVSIMGATSVSFLDRVGNVLDVDEASPADLYAITAITAPAPSSGEWQYRTAIAGSGSNWQFLSLTANQFLRVGGDVQIRFNTGPSYNTSVGVKPSLTVAALDATVNTTPMPPVANGGKGTIPTPRGGSSFMSAGEVTLEIEITPINDAPTFAMHAPTANTITITEDDTDPPGHTAAGTFLSHIGDVEDDDEVSPADLYAIIAINNTTPAKGKWEYRTSSSVAWTTLSISTNQFFRVGGSAVEVRFVPFLNYNTSTETAKPFLSVAALDATNTTANGAFGTIPSPRGGTSFMSLADRMIVVEVTAVNDAPTLASVSASNVVTFAEDATPPIFTVSITTGTTHVSFLSRVGDVQDVDETAPADLYAITAITTPASSGSWQYRRSSSVAWNTLSLSSNQFLRVGGTVEVRFLPASNYNTEGGRAMPRITVAALDATTMPTANGDFGTIPSTRGGSSFMSSADRTLEIEITAVAPYITALSPAIGSTASTQRPILDITFNEPVQVGTNKNLIIRIPALHQDIIALHPTISGREITIPLTAAMITGNRLSVQMPAQYSLPKGQEVHVLLDDEAVSDMLGTPYEATSSRNIGTGASDAEGWWTFTSVSINTDAPRIIVFNPAPGAMDVSVEPTLTIHFDEGVRENFLPTNTATITIEDITGSSTISTLSAAQVGLVTVRGIAAVAPSSNPGYSIQLPRLPANSQIRVTIGAGLFDNGGVGVSQQGVVTFQTETIAEFLPAQSTPAQGATMVAPTTTLTAAYSLPVSAGSGEIIVRARKNASTLPYIEIERIAVPSAGAVFSTVSSQGRMQITLSSPLSGNSQYEIVVSNAAVLDAPVTLLEHSWTFTTAPDTDPPTIVSVTPNASALPPTTGSASVNASGVLEIEMSELIEKSTGGDIEIWLNYGASSELYRTIPITSPSVSIVGRTIFIAHDNTDGTLGDRLSPDAYDDPLPGGSTYFVRMDANTVQDFSGNDGPVAITSSSYWTFTTASGSDGRRPSVESTKITLGGAEYTATYPAPILNVPIGQPFIEVTFDEPIRAGTVSPNNIVLQEVGGAGSSSNILVSSATITGRTIRFQLPAATLEYGKTYSYTIGVINLRDLTARALSVEVSQQFQTLLPAPTFSTPSTPDTDVVVVLDNTAAFTLSGGMYTPTDITPFALDLTSTPLATYDALEWYTTEADANAGMNSISVPDPMRANPEYQHLLSKSSNALQSVDDVGIYPFWVKQNGTTRGLHTKVRLIVLKQSSINVMQTPASGSATLLTGNPPTIFLPTSDTYSLTYPYKEAPPSIYSVSWSGGAVMSPALNISDLDNEATDRFNLSGAVIPPGDTFLDVDVILTLFRDAGMSTAESYTVTQTVRVFQSNINFDLVIDDGNTVTSDNEVCQSSGTHNFAITSYDVSAFNSLRATPATLVTGTVGMTNWVINTDVISMAGISSTFTITRHVLNSAMIVQAGTSTITMYQAPTITFSSISRNNYCRRDLDATLEVTIGNAAGVTATRQSGLATTAPNTLSGTLQIFTSLSPFSPTNTPTLRATIPVDFSAYNFSPRTLYSTAIGTAPAQNTVYIRFVYTSSASEDVSMRNCQGSVTRDFVVHNYATPPTVSAGNNQLYCEGDPVGSVSVSSPAVGVTYKWYTSSSMTPIGGVSTEIGSGSSVGGTTYPAPGGGISLVNTSLPNTYSIYLSATEFVAGLFAGCESGVTKFDFTVVAKPTASLSFTPSPSVCIGEGATANVVEVDDVTSRSGSYMLSYQINEIVNHSDMTVSSAHNTVYENVANISQTNSHDPIRIDVAGVAALLESMVTTDASTWVNFGPTTATIRYQYTEVLADAGSCAADAVDQPLTIYALPEVEIVGFEDKHCQYESDKRMQVRVSYPGTAASVVDWQRHLATGGEVSAVSGGRNPNTLAYGEFVLFRSDGVRDAMGNFTTYTEQHNSSGSPLLHVTSGGFFRFSDQMTSSEPIFQLRYASSPNQDARPVGCVNTATYDFTIYERPSPPTVLYAFVPTNQPDEYCTGPTIVSDVQVSTIDLMSAYRWYDNASGSAGNLVGTGVPTEATSYTPNVDLTTATAGMHKDYLTEVKYRIVGSFEGCESYAAEVIIEVISPSSIDFEFQVGGSAVTRSCVADGSTFPAATSQMINIVPTSPVSVGSVLGSGNRLTFQAINASGGSDLGVITSLITNQTQVSAGTVAAAQLSAYGALDHLIDPSMSNVPGIRDNFSNTNLWVRVTYERVLSGGTCSARIDKMLEILPLPAVEIVNFDEKHCSYESNKQIEVQLQVGVTGTAFTFDWIRSGVANGNVTLWQTGVQGSTIPNNGEFVFSGLMGDWQLRYTSAPDQDTRGVGCVNIDTYDFTIYERPSPPTVNYASGGTQDRYCQGTAASINAVTASTTITMPAPVYRWYENASGSAGNLVGTGAPTEATSYTPIIDLSIATPGTYRDYVTEVRYVVAPFQGCESFAREVVIEVVAPPNIDFRFDVGTSTNITSVCIAGGTGMEQMLSFVPIMPVAGVSLNAGDEASFEAVHSLTAISDAINLEISNRTQTGGTSVTLSSATISTLEVANQLNTAVTDVADPFLVLSFTVRFTYTEQIGGASCTSQVDKMLSIQPLPVVSIEDFGAKVCRDSSPLELKYRVGSGAEEIWNSRSPTTGMFELQWNEGSAYQSVPNFHRVSRLNMDELFMNNLPLTAAGMGPSTSPDFRLVYVSSPSPCVGRSALDFTIYPIPVSPTLNKTSDVYCEQSTRNLESVSVASVMPGFTYNWYNSLNVLQSSSPQFIPTGLSLQTEDVLGDEVSSFTYSVEAVAYVSLPFVGCRSAPTTFNVELVGRPEISVRDVRDDRDRFIPTGDAQIPVCIARVENTTGSNLMLEPITLQFAIMHNRVRMDAGSVGVVTGNGASFRVVDTTNPLQLINFDPLIAVQAVDSRIQQLSDLQDRREAVDIAYTYTNVYQGLSCETSIERTIYVLGLPAVNFTSNNIFDTGDMEVEVCVNHDAFTVDSSLPSTPLPEFNVDGVIVRAVSVAFDPSQIRNASIRNSSTYMYLPRSEHRITLIAESGMTGCSNFLSKKIFINPIPDVDFDLDYACETESVELRASIDNEATLVTPISYGWSIADSDGFPVTLPDPSLSSLSLRLDPARTHTIELNVRDNVDLITRDSDGNRIRSYGQGCSTVIRRTARAGKVPNPVLAWENITSGEPTTFHFNESNLPIDEIETVKFKLEKGNSTIASFERSTSSTFFNDLEYVFSKSELLEKYQATFEASSSLTGCASTVSHVVHILPKISLQTGSTYLENFDTDHGNWHADTLLFTYRPANGARAEELGKPQVIEVTHLRSSWGWGRPIRGTSPANSAVFIRELLGGDGNAWLTNTRESFERNGNKVGYLRNENSWIYSPEFDISDLVRPMLSFDLMYHFDNQKSGAVLQYSSDGGKNWYTVGNFTEESGGTGINWYNHDLILADPGSQSLVGDNNLKTNNVGWASTQEENGWQISRHALDEIPSLKRSRVRFRFALAAPDESVQGDGIGIDNFWIGERGKIVLIEEFASELTTRSQQVHSEISNILLSGQTSGLDAIRITYYSFPPNVSRAFHSDRLYSVSAEDVNARQFFYGVPEVPSSVIDGDYSQIVSREKNIVGWTQTTLNRAALEIPSFSIEFEEPRINDENISITLKVRLTEEGLNRGRTGTYRVYVTVVEELVRLEGKNGQTEFRDVMRKMLPDAAGTPISFENGVRSRTINLSWRAFRTYFNEFDRADINFSELDLRMIAFVQDPLTKKVYQTAEQAVRPEKVLSLGIKDTKPSEKIRAYPNPVIKHALIIQLPSVLYVEMEWQIMNTAGVLLGKGNLRRGDQLLQLDLKSYADGLYYLLLRQDDQLVFSKKILIQSE